MHGTRRNLLAGAVAYGAAALIAAAGVGFLAYAVFLLFALILPAWAAALITAGIMLFTALVVAWILRSILRAPERRRPADEGRGSGLEAQIRALLDPEVLDLISRNARSATLLALLAGGALGASADVRAGLGRILSGLGSREPGE